MWVNEFVMNDWKDRLGVVFSTASDFEYEHQGHEEQSTLSPSQQNLRVWLDSKHRAGKSVTIVRGFMGSEADLKELGKLLKSRCGVGGSVKDGEVIIQGNHRDKVVDILTKSGYRCKRAGG